MAKLTRRSFLGAGAVLGAGFAAAAIWRGTQWRRGRDPAPVVVVGCGASGLMTALALVSRGVPVVCLESGPLLEPAEARERPFGAPDEPFEGPFNWIRMRQVGGKLVQWLGHCPRLSPRDLSEGGERSRGEVWPLGYDELSPYYTRVERILGVTGAPAGLPDLPDGEFVAALAPRPIDLHLGPRLARMGVTLTPGRFAIYPRAWSSSELGARPVRRDAQSDQQLRVFDSLEFVRAELLAHPLFALIPNAHVLRLEIGPDDALREVLYLDKQAGEQKALPARNVVLAAGALESAVVLLDSAGPRHEAGAGNASGDLGRHVSDHLQVGVGFRLASLARASGGSALDLPNPGHWGSLIHCVDDRVDPRVAGPYSFQVIARELPDGGAEIYLNGMGSVVPRAENRIVLTGKRTPQGLPIPQIHFELDATLHALKERMAQSAVGLMAACEAERATDPWFAGPGGSIHYAGTCRMGPPGAGVVDNAGRVQGVRGVLVADAGVFPTLPPKNPTLTMLALGLRNGELLADAI